MNLIDSYKSLNEALVHGGIPNDSRVKLRFVDSEKMEKDGIDRANSKAPGGFSSPAVSATGGSRG